MTQDEIIEMARQAGFSLTHSGIVQLWLANRKDIEAFARLIEADVEIKYARLTNEKLIEMYEAGQLAEREACAMIADEYVGQDLEHNFSALVAYNIRARGEA